MFEHENRIILSLYLLHYSLYRKELVAHGYSSPFKSGLTQSASMHFIIGGGKGKPYGLAKIHKNVKNKERTVIVKCFVKDTVCH